MILYRRKSVEAGVLWSGLVANFGLMGTSPTVNIRKQVIALSRYTNIGNMFFHFVAHNARVSQMDNYIDRRPYA